MTGTYPFTSESFEGLSKIEDVPFSAFCAKRRIKIAPCLAIEPETSLAQGLAALYRNREIPAFFQVIANALPVREAVWLACLAGARMLPAGAEHSPALKAAQAWVYQPTLENREIVEQAIMDSDMDDPTVLAADAAFHGIAKGLEDAVKSPPSACPTMVFALLVKAAFMDDDPEKAEENWQKLVEFALNIAAGGTGRNEAQ
jgi:hypothetical protein